MFDRDIGKASKNFCFGMFEGAQVQFSEHQDCYGTLRN